MLYFPAHGGGTHPRAITKTHTAAPDGYSGPIAPDIKTITYVDGLGRALEVRKTAVVNGVTGFTTAGLASFDNVGRVVRTQNPFFTAGSSESFATSNELGTTTAYDDQDRPVLVTYADDATETTSFSISAAPDGVLLFKTQHVDPNGHSRESFADHLGRTRAFVEHPTSTTSSVTRYVYFATGELSRIIDAEGNQTSLAYDLRGLRTVLDNPDTGRIEDRFDLMGNRIVSIEPNHRALGVQVHYVFDKDRLAKIDYASKEDVELTYGELTDTAKFQVGRIKHITDESGSRDFEYGRMGETTRTIRTVKPDQNGSQSIVFDLRTTSDSLGRLLRIGYPDGVVVTNSFDAAGNLAEVKGAGAGWTRTYATGIQYDVFGNRNRLEYGNHVVSTWQFDSKRIRLSNVKTTLPDSAQTLIQNLSYEYFAGSNPKTIRNDLATLWGGSGNQPGTSKLDLEYDGVDRLLIARGTADLSAQKTTHYDQFFAYSASHNLLHKERAHTITQPGGIPTAPTATNFASNYLYDAARPHMPKQVGDLAITYDPSGNPTTRRTLTTGNVQSLVWDDDNRMVDFTSGGVHQHNTFDSAGNRVRRKSTQSETLFSSMYFDLENGTQGVRHVFAGGTRIASVLGKFAGGESPAPPNKPGTHYFFQVDRLNSTSVISAEDASVHESIEYFPDGEAWIDRAPQKPFNGYLFSGKTFDPDTGFYDFGQRFYEPRTSLWLGVDPILTDETRNGGPTPAHLSVLAFAGNNPQRNADIDGRDFLWVRTVNGNPRADYVPELGRPPVYGSVETVHGDAGRLRYLEDQYNRAWFRSTQQLMEAAAAQDLAISLPIMTAGPIMMEMGISASLSESEGAFGVANNAQALARGYGPRIATIDTAAVGTGETAAQSTARTFSATASTVTAEAPTLHGPYVHHLTKGGLDEIMASKKLMPGEQGTYGIGGNAVRAYIQDPALLNPSKMKAPALVFRTKVPPTSTSIPQSAAIWNDVDEGLSIVIERVVMPGKLPGE
jgi:RHS repeat-associated protein